MQDIISSLKIAKQTEKHQSRASISPQNPKEASVCTCAAQHALDDCLPFPDSKILLNRVKQSENTFSSQLQTCPHRSRDPFAGTTACSTQLPPPTTKKCFHVLCPRDSISPVQPWLPTLKQKQQNDFEFSVPQTQTSTFPLLGFLTNA